MTTAGMRKAPSGRVSTASAMMAPVSARPRSPCQRRYDPKLSATSDMKSVVSRPLPAPRATKGAKERAKAPRTAASRLRKIDQASRYTDAASRALPAPPPARLGGGGRGRAVPGGGEGARPPPPRGGAGEGGRPGELQPRGEHEPVQRARRARRPVDAVEAE